MCCIDGTIFKINVSAYNIIQIEEVNYLENLINTVYDDENKDNLLEELKKYYINNEIDEFNKNIIENIEKN